MSETRAVDPEMNKALEGLQAAAEPLARLANAKAQARRKQFLKRAIEGERAIQADRREMSEPLARLRYGHAVAVNFGARFCPDYPPRLLKRYLPWVPVSLDRLSAERHVVETLFGWKLSALDPCMTMNPRILSAPEILRPGESFTVTGDAFGPPTGSVSLLLATTPGISVPCTVSTWSQSAVMFTIPQAVPGGVPLHAQGTLTIHRSDTNPSGAHCSVSVSVLFEPDSVFLQAEVAVSAAGVNLNPLAGPYSREHTLTSPVLPPRAEPHPIGGSDVLINISSVEFDAGDDDPPSFAVSSGPVFTLGSQRQVKVIVTDDWSWDYVLNASFIVIQPADEVVPLGWAIV